MIECRFRSYMLAEGGHQKDLTTGQAIGWLLHLVYREQAYHLEFYCRSWIFWNSHIGAGDTQKYPRSPSQPQESHLTSRVADLPPVGNPPCCGTHR